MTELLCPIAYNAKYAPNSPAIIIDSLEISYTDLDRAVEGMCDTLKILGVDTLTRVPFLAHLQKETIILLFALFRLGKIACPISPKFPEDAKKNALDRLGVSFLLDPQKLSYQPKDTSSLPFLSSKECATLLFTSGSSGSPKIAAHCLWNHFANALSTFVPLQLDPDSKWHLSLPLYHVGGLAILFRCFLAGASVVLSPTLSSTLTHVSFVPTQLYRLLKDPKLTDILAKSLKCILLGGAPISQSLYSQAIQAGLKVCPTYGMTEMSSIITVDTTLDRELSSGHKLYFRDVKIGKNQEILVRGDTLFQGYWDKEKGLTLPISDGYFTTGDLGEFNSEGKLKYLGRKDNLFISGGENIQPEEIETHLLKLEGIQEAVIVPTFDPEFGERPAAFIKTDKAYTLEEIQERLGHILPKYKLPVALHKLIDDGSLKVSRSKLKEMLKPK